MSRPPLPRPSRPGASDETLDLLPIAYSDLLALEETLAVEALDRPLPPPGEPEAEPDVARTLMEMSALVGHVLGVYQRLYKGELYLGTAQAASSLVRHARRLAYVPDTGLAPTGHVVLEAKEGVSGTVAKGLALASVPLGEQRSMDFHTREDVLVDHELNAVEPRDAMVPAKVSATSPHVRLEGTGHRLAAGDQVALVGSSWAAYAVVDAREEDGTTLVTFDRAPEPVAGVGGKRPRLLAHPTRTLRPFGADAQPALFPPKAVLGARAYTAKATTWYDVTKAGGGEHSENDVYLSEKVDEPLVGQFVLRRDGTTSKVLKVHAEVLAGVTLHHVSTREYERSEVHVDKQPDGNWKTTVKKLDAPGKEELHNRVSATVTAIQVHSNPTTKAAVARGEHPFPADWLTGWATEASLAAQEPNTGPVPKALALKGKLTALSPGRPLVFSDRAGLHSQVVTIQSVSVTEEVTTIGWQATGVGKPPPLGWKLGDLLVRANVAPVAMGRAVREVLGDSDGVTAFQRFTLRQSPVTVLPAATGGEPALEVRVQDVAWQRVADFYDSGRDDRHYRSETDETGATTVVFGDGRNGAVPPPGEIVARYFVGLGDVVLEAHRLSRLKRAHLLLDGATNLTPIGGGADPADVADVRLRATDWIRTCDRAVSVEDLAHLALTMPGIARASARWDPSRGALLVVATSSGDAPPALDAVRAFLDARRDTSVPLTLLAPEPHDLCLVVELEPDPAYLLEVVRQSVRDALHGTAEDAPGLFTFPARDLGQPAFRSEVYERLEALPGVVGVVVTTFQAVDLSRTEPERAEVVPAGVDQWLRLLPANLDIRDPARTGA